MNNEQPLRSANSMVPCALRSAGLQLARLREADAGENPEQPAEAACGLPIQRTRSPRSALGASEPVLRVMLGGPHSIVEIAESLRRERDTAGHTPHFCPFVSRDPDSASKLVPRRESFATPPIWSKVFPAGDFAIVVDLIQAWAYDPRSLPWRCPLRLRRLAACAIATLFHASPAQATLIDLGNGTIYDTVQDLTWLQDVGYSRTSGFDADGLMSYMDATAWADSLAFGGYEDWRLPRFIGTPPLHANRVSEITRLLAQLGHGWVEDADGIWHYGRTLSSEDPAVVAPFVNFFNPNGLESFWFGNEVLIWNVVRDWDVPDGSAFGHYGAWAVRDGGNPSARVPEPSTWLLLGTGLVLARRRGGRAVARR